MPKISTSVIYIYNKLPILRAKESKTEVLLVSLKDLINKL